MSKVSKRELEIIKCIIEGKHDFNEIREAIGLKKSVVSEYITKLKKEGLIVEHKNPKDGRKKYYELNENELLLVTRKELIKIIEEELQRKLSDDELKSIEKILIEFVRPALIELVKMYDDNAEIKSLSGSIKDVIEQINSIVVGYYWYDTFKLNISCDTMAKYSKNIFPEYPHLAHLYKAIEYLPKKFAEDWVKTKAFKSSIANPLLKFINLMNPDFIDFIRNHGEDEKNGV